MFVENLSGFFEKLQFHTSKTKWQRNVIVVLLVVNLNHAAEAKTVQGVFTTHLAQAGKGQYVTSFAFHGDAVLNFTVNTTGNGAKLYLFVSESWHDAAVDTDCQRRFTKAGSVVTINETTGRHLMPHSNYPHIWHIVYADVYTCDLAPPKEAVEKPNIIQYTIQLCNPDSLGNPTEHFGDQETGLLKFYQLLSLIYFVVACVVAPQLWATLSKGGPMQLLIQLLTVAMSLQAFAALTIIVHLYRYSKDGVGAPYFELVSEFLDMLSQSTMLFMLLSLSLGWSLASAHSVCRYSHLRTISQKPAARVVYLLGVVQALLFMWEQRQDQSLRLYYARRSYAGISLVVLQILLAAMFAFKLKELISSERSTLKRQFYSSFTKLCMMWFLCYPAVVMTSWLTAEYLRDKFITMGVLICQSIAGVLLYRLFLSRSLYWEVSALSSSLPFRLNYQHGLKFYS
ncbi:unnamed protein product [Candidula unifasciata]|uniref:Intimal thickness related receptor IRP domain-containing protein n=1 Tax=Candidula unifasciata TaxID=100452 RepID=A0A8S3YYR3_9EUPU|nr:unnamed protein product [Candidula unifasciata]